MEPASSARPGPAADQGAKPPADGTGSIDSVHGVPGHANLGPGPPTRDHQPTDPRATPAYGVAEFAGLVRVLLSTPKTWIRGGETNGTAPTLQALLKQT
jgi:hypothetical protein